MKSCNFNISSYSFLEADGREDNSFAVNVSNGYKSIIKSDSSILLCIRSFFFCLCLFASKLLFSPKVMIEQK